MTLNGWGWGWGWWVYYVNSSNDDDFLQKTRKTRKGEAVSAGVQKEPRWLCKLPSALLRMMMIGQIVLQTFHPEIGKRWQKLQKQQKLPKVALANSWQELPKTLATVTKSCEQFGKVAKSCGKLPQVAKNAKRCQQLSKVVKKLAKVVTTKSCKKMHLPTVGNSYQKIWQELPRVTKSCQHLPTVVKNCHKLKGHTGL